MKLLKIAISEVVNEGKKFVLDENNLISYDEFLLLKSTLFKDRGVVYFIFVEKELKYIGKSKGKNFKQRMRNHFITKNKKTASKLDKITKEINAGKKVNLSFLLTEKESFRSVIEDELILWFKDKYELWNEQKG